jgi:5-methylcytosine-specific restriction endonuclease McrA
MAYQVLALDQSGLPHKWIPLEDAVFYYAKDLVAWDFGEVVKPFRGGISALTGSQSRIEPKSIIAVKNCNRGSWLQGREPSLCNDTLFSRDRFVCAYCGENYRERDLSRDHVHPVSRGGLDVWQNVVTACRSCNNKKADKLPQEANMELLYLPYQPNRFEHFILQNRHILADQMEFLLPNVGRASRLRKH